MYIPIFILIYNPWLYNPLTPPEWNDDPVAEIPNVRNSSNLSRQPGELKVVSSHEPMKAAKHGLYVSIYIYTYVYMYIYIYMYVYIYIYTFTYHTRKKSQVWLETQGLHYKTRVCKNPIYPILADSRLKSFWSPRMQRTLSEVAWR